jgi:hypothetical protein
VLFMAGSLVGFAPGREPARVSTNLAGFWRREH